MNEKTISLKEYYGSRKLARLHKKRCRGWNKYAKYNRKIEEYYD